MRAVRPDKADDVVESSARGASGEEEVWLPRHQAESNNHRCETEVDRSVRIMPVEERQKHASRYYGSNEEREDDLGRDGEPGRERLEQDEADDSPEAIIGEEEKVEGTTKPKVVRVPRVPTQRETGEHEAVHLPHADLCEVCTKRR